jgi:ribosome biogenesis protein NSA2
MKKLVKQHEEKDIEVNTDEIKGGALPTFLMDREQATSSKILSNTIKQKRKEKAGRWSVPI